MRRPDMLRDVTTASLACALGACAAVPAPGGPITGAWGGEHVALALDARGGALEYDCAAGRIDEPVIAGPGGGFTADGSHTPGTGGPERVGEVRPSYPARYTGNVTGDTMRLNVTVPARGLELGPFVLRRGAQAQLLRCL